MAVAVMHSTRIVANSDINLKNLRQNVSLICSPAKLAFPSPAHGSLSTRSLCNNASRVVASCNLPSASGPPSGAFGLNWLSSLASVGKGRSSASRRAASSSGEATLDSGDGGSGGGKSGGSSGGGGGDGDGNEPKKIEYLTYAEVVAAAAAKNAKLPADVIALAQQGKLQKAWLESYLAVQAQPFVGPLCKVGTIIRDRMVADPKYLFKVLSEVAIDSVCCTYAEVTKRGEHFWDELEFYFSDVLVGLVMDVALVTMMAPVASLAGARPSAAKSNAFSAFLKSLPGSCFEKTPIGKAPYTVAQRTSTIFVKGGEYAVIGLVCGGAGQTLANGFIAVRRALTGNKKSEAKDGAKPAKEAKQVVPPPVLKTAGVWALFMGVSSNLRYQTLNGLERVLENSFIGRRFPPLSYGGTIVLRFANNVIGGEQFIDMARYFGVQ
eukprot:jgi/Mesvir1/12135/Mv00389-RA.1